MILVTPAPDPAAPDASTRAIDAPIAFDRAGFSDQELLDIYSSMLLPRLIEEKMLILLRQNKISKWFSGIGQEAVAVGTTLALRDDDFIFPLHRNLGVFTARNIPLERLFCQWQGKREGFTKGRDRSFHFGTLDYRVVGMISHLGAMLGVADGVALASNLDGAERICLAYSGDGGASEGDFHEALNTAAVWDLPVVFLVENNGYGLSTPSSEQFRCKQFIDKAYGYGIQGVQADGNNVLEMISAARYAAELARTERRPILLEALTFRMRGHEEASGVKYVPKELLERWAAKDPVVNYENFLKRAGVLTDEHAERIRAEHKRAIKEGLEKMFATPDIAVVSEADELDDVYPPGAAPSVFPTAPLSAAPQKRMIDAISEGLAQAMERDPSLVLMGQDVAEYGGVFKITQGFVERFGKARVRNTPLCESAIIAAGMGLSLAGKRATVEMQFADFVSCGFNQIINNLAKTHYRWGHAPKVTVRLPTGAGVAAGPFHSQSTEAFFAHVPGLKIVFPATAFDAKGLIAAALADPGPVLYFEHKKLYRSVQDATPDEYYTVEIGKAALALAGSDVTVVTYGLGVHWALAAAAAHPGAVEIVDLRTLLPWDKTAVFDSVRKTGKCIVLHEDTHTGGFGAEIAATVGQEMFAHLDAPVVRVAALDTPVPFNAVLENQFLPAERFKLALDKMLAY